MIRMMTAIVLVLGVVTAAVSAQEAARPTAKAAAASTPAGMVNLNSATAAQLETLPGIGKATAERILEYRQKNGAFKKVEELLESSRSGPILLRIVCFDPPPTVSESRKKSQEISA